MSRHITVKLGVEVLGGQRGAYGLPAGGNIGLNSFLPARQ
jgi:hypothetical protein